MPDTTPDTSPETVAADTSPVDSPPPGEARPSRPRQLVRLVGQLAIFLLLVVLLQTAQGWLRAPDLPERAPAFTLPDLEGGTVRLSDFEGRTVVLNFWATWCGPCRVEIPSFSRFADRHDDTVVLGIAVDGEPEALRRAQDDLGITYPVLRADRQTLAAYDVSSLPTTVVVRGDGTVRSSYAGMLFGPQLWWMTR